MKLQTANAKFGADIPDLLTDLLNCTICFYPCSIPIYMCPNGHNVCSNCQPQLKECPLCRHPGRPEHRNHFAEQVSVNAWRDCKNVGQGCPQSLKIKDMPVHLEFCEYGYKCMFENCVWRGSVVDLEAHVKQNHSDFYFDCSLGGVTVLNDYRQELFEPVEEDSVVNVSSDNAVQVVFLRRLTTAMIAYKDHVFWYHAEHLGTNSLKVQLRVIGATKESIHSPLFSYQLKFKSIDRSRTLFYTNRVRSLADGAYSDVVFNDPLTLSPYLDGSLLSFKLELAVVREDDQVTFEDPGDGFPEVRISDVENWERLSYKDLDED